MSTPITDATEAEMEAQGKRDVPVRVYQQMRALEEDRDALEEALREVANMAESLCEPSAITARARAALARFDGGKS